ncbi:MAG: hypothetical protein AAFQ02_11265, partial [Bacteroidota bacterium]
MYYLSLLFTVLINLNVAQDDVDLTTLLFSSIATPDRLNLMIEELAEEGIRIEILHIVWNEEKTQIKEVDVSVQTRNSEGSWQQTEVHNFRYNVLNEGVVFFVQAGSKLPLMISAHNMHLLDDVSESGNLVQMVFPKNVRSNKVFTTFCAPFDGTNIAERERATRTLFQRLDGNNELIATVLSEREPGKVAYAYRYYYNGRQLTDSF